jgi:hypothetical protein
LIMKHLFNYSVMFRVLGCTKLETEYTFS